MPDDGRQIAKMTNQDLQALPFDQAFEVWSPNIATALPDHIPLDRFRRVVITAVNQNAKLARADRRSLFNACAKCAHDGLYPDGREAALVVYSTKVKRGDDEFWVDMVQYLPMIAGIRKRMRNTGEVLSATAEVVYIKDTFHYRKGEDPHIEHEPRELGEDRGQRRGAYAIIKLANGEVLRETMSASDIEHVMRTFAKGWDKKGSPWQTSRDEMWRKTVLRRCAKSAPNGSELDRIFARDDERDQPHAGSPLRAIPRRPQPEDYLSITEAETETETETEEEAGDQAETDADAHSFQITDSVGEITEFATPEEARDALLGMMKGAKSSKELEALWENNTTSGAIEELANFDEVGEAPLLQAYGEARAALAPKSGNGKSSEPAGETDQIKHPEEQRQPAIQTARKDPSTTPTSAAAPRDESKTVEHAPRDENFWSQKKFLLPGKTAKEVLYYTHNYLRQCRDQFDINGIETDNASRFQEMSANDRKEVERMIGQRRKELPA